MANKIIEARVIQKVATEAEWLQTTLPLYQGEIAFVSDKNNFKLNTQPQAKTFAELEYFYKGDILSGVLPTDDLASKPDGVYRATTSGTYSGVVVKEGYYTLLRKSSNVWSLESEVKMPMQSAEGKVEEGNTQAVSGGKVYHALYDLLYNQGIDLSRLFNNFNLDLKSAIDLIPNSLRKRNIIIKFNDSESYKFCAPYSDTNFKNIKNWIKDLNPNENLINLFDNAIVYEGFAFVNSNTVSYHKDNKVAIIPLKLEFESDGVTYKKIPFSSDLKAIQGITSLTGILNTDLSGVYTGNINSSSVSSNWAYAYVNLAYNNGTELLKSTDETDYSKVIFFPKYEFSNSVLKNEIKLNRIYNEEFFLQKYKVNDSYYLSECLEFVSAKIKGKDVRYLNTDFFIWVSVFTSYGGGATIKFKYIDPFTNEEKLTAPSTNINNEYRIETNPVFIQNDVIYQKIVFPFMELIFKIYPKKMGIIENPNLIDIPRNYSEIKKETLNSIFSNSKNNEKASFINFESFLPNLITNYNYKPPTPLNVKNVAKNMKRLYVTEGDGSVHGQSILISRKSTNLKGNKTVTFFNDLSNAIDNPPKISVIREKSAANYSIKKLGSTLNQWIHPDMIYCDNAVGGFKYWLVNSIYPYSNPSNEDSELFVSNDGFDWKRITSLNEIDNNGLSLKLPPNYWGVSGYLANTFMPIPQKDKVLEFATESSTRNMTVKSFLNHDPAISYSKGYVNIYITYNLGLDNTVQSHKYVVCYRTNNGIDWQVVREDGTTFEYNEVNAQMIFSKTNGVRNHIRYFYSGEGVTIGSFDACPQVVKVNEGKYYMYYQRTQNGGSIGLIRYSGTSPYKFDFSTYETCSMDKPLYGRFWHFGIRYYNGVYYLIYDGNICTSIDGLNFIQSEYPFFWRGGSADLYKPTFAIAPDGKVKIAYSLQITSCYETSSVNEVRSNSSQYDNIITQTLVAEYTSINDILNKGNINKSDAYIDAFIYCINDELDSDSFTFIPYIQGNYKFKNINFKTGDEVQINILSNTRNLGKVEFSGVIIDDRL